MRPGRIEFVRLAIPLRTSFSHSRASRSVSDNILVLLEDRDGTRGFGEILARTYVTGESMDSIWESAGPAAAERLIDAEVEGIDDLRIWRSECDAGPALAGGLELALLNVLAQRGVVDLRDLIGEPRQDSPRRCVTIGLGLDEEPLRRLARQALLTGAAIKVKVAAAEDADYVLRLERMLGGRIPLRMDANGTLDLDEAVSLVEALAAIPIHSLEQPFPAGSADEVDHLTELRARTGIALTADESVCTLDDAHFLLEQRVYQFLNLRVGKAGLIEASRIAAAGREAGVGLLGGTMVGETGVMNCASAALLSRVPEMPYMEGLGQNVFLLQMDPVVARGGGGPAGELSTRFELREDLPDEWTVGRKVIA